LAAVLVVVTTHHQDLLVDLVVVREGQMLVDLEINHLNLSQFPCHNSEHLVDQEHLVEQKELVVGVEAQEAVVVMEVLLNQVE
jgi:hypothetical protein